MKAVYRTFAGGEITPELVARADLAENQSGLALCDNFIVRQNGTLVRRGGLQHICTVNRIPASSLFLVHPQIIPFTMPAGDQVGVVVGCGMQSANTAPVVQNNTAAEFIISVPVVAVSGTTVTIGINVGVGSSVLPRGFASLARTVRLVVLTSVVSGPNWNVTFGWADGTPLTAAETARYFQAGVDVLPALAVGAFQLNTVGGGKRYRFSQENDVATVTLDDPGSGIQAFEVALNTINPLAFNSSGVVFGVNGAVPPTGITATATVATGVSLRGDRYYVSSVSVDGSSESLTGSSGAVSNNLQTDGNYNTITWSAASPAPQAYRVYYAPGDSTARVFIGETAGLSFVHDKRTQYDDATKPLTSIPATINFRAVAHHEQRRFFAGAAALPQTVYGSRVNAPSNYTSSFPLRADDALIFRLNSTQRVSIQHLTTFIDLLAFTQNSVFRIYSGDNGALRPASLAAKPQGTTGANSTQPVVTPTSVIFAQANGDKLRELTYTYNGNGFATDDAGVFASHLFYKRGIFTLTYAQSPDSIVWLANHGGSNQELVTYTTARLLGMTYVPELSLRAWHQHSMSSAEDFVMAVRSLRIGFVDYLYAIVARKVPGVNFYDINVERMAPSNTSTDVYDGAHLDMHVNFDNGSPVSVLTGLFHLGGRTVTALLDGIVYRGLFVSADGAVTLPVAATKILIGVEFSSRLQTLPMWAGNAGTTKNASGVRIRILNSNYVSAGPSFDRLTEHQARLVSTSYDTAQPLRAYEARFTIGPSWNDDGSVCVEQSLPLPLTVCGMAVEYAQGS